MGGGCWKNTTNETSLHSLDTILKGISFRSRLAKIVSASGRALLDECGWLVEIERDFPRRGFSHSMMAVIVEKEGAGRDLNDFHHEYQKMSGKTQRTAVKMCEFEEWQRAKWNNIVDD